VISVEKVAYLFDNYVKSAACYFCLSTEAESSWFYTSQNSSSILES